MELLASFDCGVESPYNPAGRVSMGTTIMAAEFADGVVVGADCRTTAGVIVHNRSTNKLTPISPHIYVLRSGAAADTQAIADVVTYNVDALTKQLGYEPPVKAAATLFQTIVHNYREQLSAGLIVAGWDESLGGQVYSIPLGGMCVRQPVTMGGSGSTYVWGHIDATYQRNWDLKQTVRFVVESVSLAIGRDGGSGGGVRLAVVDKSGTKRYYLPFDQLPKFYDG